MKKPDNSCSHRRVWTKAERGVSIVELLIVVAMIGVVTSFAVMRIGGAQRAMRLSNSAREFMSWLDKTRLDSIRRHAQPADMASVEITSANTYIVTIDQNGDGVLDPPRTISFPATHGATFSDIAVPTTIYYNWRGRPVDAAGNLLNLSFSLSDAGGNNNPINLTSTGDASLRTDINTENVNVSQMNSTDKIKSKAVLK